VDTTRLRTQAEKMLPEYMVPAPLIALAGLPLRPTEAGPEKAARRLSGEVRGEERVRGPAEDAD